MSKKQHSTAYRAASKLMFYAFAISMAIVMLISLFSKGGKNKEKTEDSVALVLMDRQRDSLVKASYGDTTYVVSAGQLSLVKKENPYNAELQSVRGQINMMKSLEGVTMEEIRQWTAPLIVLADSLVEKAKGWKESRMYVRTLFLMSGQQKAACFQMLDENGSTSYVSDYSIQMEGNQEDLNRIQEEFLKQ